MEEPCTTRWVICRFNGSSRRRKNLVLRRNNRPTRFSSRFFFFSPFSFFRAKYRNIVEKKIYRFHYFRVSLDDARSRIISLKIKLNSITWVEGRDRYRVRASVFVYLTDEFNKERGTRVCVFRLFVQIIG